MSFLSKLFISILCVFSVANASFKTPAKQALLVDLTTGTVLFEKNSDQLVSPSSMSKIMTAYVVLDEIKKGRLSMADKFQVSKKAWKMRGSRMFLNAGSFVSVEDLLKGLLTQSGNDAAITLAEGISGTEEAFVTLMQKVAKRIGVQSSTLTNATGWPDADHKMTLRDVAIIATRTLMDFPEFYYLYGEKEYTYNNIRQLNRNPLVHMDNMNCDGLKTGHTDSAGYSLVASTLRDGRRLLMVVNGCKTKNQRAQESRRLVTYGYRAFASATLFSAGEVVTEADVWMGSTSTVPLVSKSDIALTVPRHLVKNVTAEVVYKTPLQAPFAAGDVVAKVVVSIPGKPAREYPLIAGESAEKKGFFSRFTATFNYLVFGKTAETQKKTP